MATVSERISWQGRDVAWTRLGSGPPVVFCHGTPFSSRVWAPYADALAEDHTVYLWDMPGYGRSSKAPGHAVDFGVQGELFAALLDEWGLERPHVVAHDIGGATALRAHLLHGARYRSLMLVDVVALAPIGSPFYRFVRANPDVMPDVPAYIHAAILDVYIRAASHRGLRDDDVAALAEPWLGDVGRPAFYRQITQADERLLDEIEERLDRVEGPVRIVWGADDTWIPPDVGRRLAGLIPAATFKQIDGAGHLVQYDAPAALASELRRWLAVNDDRP